MFPLSKISSFFLFQFEIWILKKDPNSVIKRGRVHPYMLDEFGEGSQGSVVEFVIKTGWVYTCCRDHECPCFFGWVEWYIYISSHSMGVSTQWRGWVTAWVGWIYCCEFIHVVGRDHWYFLVVTHSVCSFLIFLKFLLVCKFWNCTIVPSLISGLSISWVQ